MSSIRTSVLKLALPVTVSSLLQRTGSILSVFFVGGLGAGAIAAVGVGQLIVFIAVTTITGLGAGTTVVIAQLWGAKRPRDAGEAATHAIGLSLLAACAITSAGWALGRPLMRALGVADEVLILAGPYLDIVFLLLPITSLLQVQTAALHGIGDTRTPMKAMISVNLLFLIVAYPLIYGTGALPAFGINGAAWAVGLAEATGNLVLFLRARALMAAPSRLRRDLLGSIWQVGMPVFAERTFHHAGTLLFAKVVLLYGTAAYAAHQVGLSIEAFSFMPGYGFAVAAATMAGQSIGAGKYERARLENWEVNRQAALVMAGMGLLFFLFPYALLRLFTDDAEVIALGTLFLKIAAVAQIPLALTMVVGGSLRGAGDTRFILGVTFAGMWGIRLPLAWLAGSWLQWGIAYVWCAMAADWFVRMGLLLARYQSERWKEIQVIRAPAHTAPDDRR
jgi:putative MATE family efflux protein